MLVLATATSLFDHRSGFDHPQDGAPPFDHAFDFFVVGAFHCTVLGHHHG